MQELMTAKEVCGVLRCARPTLYQHMKTQPNFPMPIYPAPRSPRWRADEVEAYLERLSGERAVRAA